MWSTDEEDESNQLHNLDMIKAYKPIFIVVLDLVMVILYIFQFLIFYYQNISKSESTASTFYDDKYGFLHNVATSTEKNLLMIILLSVKFTINIMYLKRYPSLVNRSIMTESLF